MAAFTDYKALDFSGLDAGIGRIAGRFKENRENEAILKYLESQGGQKKEGSSLSNLDADYGKTDTVAKPSPIQNNPLPKLGVQVAETEEDTQRLEGQMAAGQGAFARPQAQQPQQQGTDFARLFSTKENEFGLPPGYLAKTAQVESGNNPNARNPNSSATGLFQFVKATGQQYGLTNPLDPVASTDAAARLAADNKRALTQALGREPTAGELYLAHQQGAGGAVKLLANADAPAEAVVGPEAFRLNGGQPGMTAGQFASKWTSKIDGQGGQQAGVQMAQAQGGPQSDVPAQGAAQAQGFAIPQGMQPASKGNIDVQALKGLISAGGAARQLGLQLFQQAQTGRNFGFLTGPDGAIYRTDPRSGSLEKLTDATKNGQPPVTVGEGQTLVDPRTGQAIFQGQPKRDPAAEAYEVRRREAARAGMKEGDPGYQSFILTGKMPREDAQPLTATDKKAILEADEGVHAGETVLRSLQDAKKLSPQALGGWGAQGKAAIANNLPDWMVPDAIIGSPAQGQSTAELDNVITSNALSQLKALFGAAPTEGERKILMDIQGAIGQPDAVRQRIYDRAMQMAEQRLAFNRQRAQELRGGNYYRQPAQQGAPQQGGQPQQRQPQQGQVREGSRARNAEGVTIVLRNGQWVRE
jgi:hypothetical protein